MGVIGRPTLVGQRGAVAAAHPLAVAAAQAILEIGGNAADAAVAAHAALAVISPEACGLGGDSLFLIRRGSGETSAVNGTGALPAGADPRSAHDGGSSVTVPGAVGAWLDVVSVFGTLGMPAVLAPAVRLAVEGVVLGEPTLAAVEAQADRLARGGAENWEVTTARRGERIRQPSLAATLDSVGTLGVEAFYQGSLARAIVRSVANDGGSISVADLESHRTVLAESLSTSWGEYQLHLQPPMSQGVLLGLAASWLNAHGQQWVDRLDHVAVEATEASFGLRDQAAKGRSLLSESLEVDVDRSSRRGGPRAYLHTAGVAVADASGMVVSSLSSVFDDFGSCTYVPEGGFVLNNRAGGFTSAPNDRRPGRRPIHTLAPAMLTSNSGALAIATPGADGQVQTILQVLMRLRWKGHSLAESIAQPRWRSEDGRLLVEASHTAIDDLAERGHAVEVMPDGDNRAGAVVSAGFAALPGDPFCPTATGDWRREVWAGVA